MTVLKVLILALALLAWAHAGAIFVYPEVKVHPVTGQTIPEGMDVRQLPEGLTLPQKGNQIVLPALAGQIATFQLIVTSPGQPVTIRSKTATAIQVYAVGLVTATEGAPGEYPDVLLPADYTPQNGTVKLPASSFIPQQRQVDVYWIELPVGTAPLSLTVLVEKNSYLVTVYPVTQSTSNLPFLFNFNEYGDKYLRPFQKQGWSAPKLLETEHRIFQALHAHQGYLNPLPYKSQKGTLRNGMGPKILNDDLLNPELDWTVFDQRFGPLLDGSAFPDGQPIPYFYLPFNPNWPAPFELYFSDREKYEAIWAAFASAFMDHFKAKGWTHTRFQVYMNQKPSPKNKIPWHLDEPKGVDDYQALRYYGELTHRVFANAAPLKIDFRIDISHFFCEKHRGNPQKDFRVNGGFDILAPVVDTWVISIHSLKSITARLKARELMDAGKSVWVYGNTPAVAEPGYWAFFSAWQALQEGWQAMLIWKTFNFTGTVRNGKSCIAYLLPDSPNPSLLPSVRLKLLRESLYLHELLQILHNQPHLTAAQQHTLESLLGGGPAISLEEWAKVRQVVHTSLLNLIK